MQHVDRTHCKSFCSSLNLEPCGVKTSASRVLDPRVNAARLYVRCSGQVAETVNASTSSPYCREDEISSDPSAPCYWETFVKALSFSQVVPEAYTFVEVEMNRIWRKSMTSGDPLLPDCIRQRGRERDRDLKCRQLRQQCEFNTSKS